MNQQTPPAAALAVGSWCWHAAYYAGQWSLLDLPAGAARLGLYQVELNDFMLPPPRHSRLRRPLLHALGAPPELWRYSRATLGQLQARLAAANVRPIAWSIHSDLTHTGPAGWWQSLHWRQALAATQQLDIPILCLTLGGQQDSPTTTDTLVAHRLAALVRRSQAARPGLHIVVENHWGLSSDIPRLLAILTQAQDLLPAGLRPQLGLCFDPGNLPAAKRTTHWPALAHLARHFHFKSYAFDAAGRETSLPYDQIFALLNQAGYRGYVVVEYEGEGDPGRAIRHSLALYHTHAPPAASASK
ncbi:MAG: sugar phosphate isomerase/epimerase [Anaerolineales bacterium]|nr:sugar phosphate isomerase/epimerase [Anaerolineales bacterium]